MRRRIWAKGIVFRGRAGSRIRTDDLLITNQLLRVIYVILGDVLTSVLTYAVHCSL
jgi:hypothetical protein